VFSIPISDPNVSIHLVCSEIQQTRAIARRTISSYAFRMSAVSGRSHRRKTLILIQAVWGIVPHPSPRSRPARAYTLELHTFTIAEEKSPRTYYGAKDLADGLRTVRKNTLIIAEEIPEDRYGFRAAPETRTVAQILTHIAVAQRMPKHRSIRTCTQTSVHGSRRRTAGALPRPDPGSRISPLDPSRLDPRREPSSCSESKTLETQLESSRRHAV
jgi:hypothetical protein